MRLILTHWCCQMDAVGLKQIGLPWPTKIPFITEQCAVTQARLHIVQIMNVMNGSL